jgi:uncharacterized protein YndB with AHSA1/START domain
MKKAELARFIDRYTIEYVRVYPHPIERVWRAVSRPEGISAWFWTADFEPQLGAAYRFGGADSGMDGVITAFEPPGLIRFGGPSCHGPEGYIQIALEAVAEGTRLTFLQHSQPGFWKSDWPIDPPELEEGPGLPWRPGTLSGWHGALDCLGELLDGGTPAHRSSQEGPLFEVYREHMRSIPAC